MQEKNHSSVPIVTRDLQSLTYQRIHTGEEPFMSLLYGKKSEVDCMTGFMQVRDPSCAPMVAREWNNPTFAGIVERNLMSIARKDACRGETI